LKQNGRLDRQSVVAGDLFVYGSLRCPEVLEVLLGRVPQGRPATATGWRAAKLMHQIYPGLTPAEGTAEGIVISDLSEAEWQMLNTFEDPIYDLRRLELSNADSAWAYVCSDGTPVSDDNWDIDQFISTQMEAYVTRCRIWRKAYEEKLR
jgi:gamma-glutamylcyclotransferase (GGCT)/AIG2-like uncharacterized protein YtfP